MSLQKSWVTSANATGCQFPLNNLPYGVFSVGEDEPRCGVAIGDQILDVAALEEAGIIAPGDLPVFDVPFWNDFMELGPDVWKIFRTRLQQLLGDGLDDTLSSNETLKQEVLVNQSDATLYMPFVVAEYTDFYSGKNHATNVGTMFRGAENALPPNWLHMPIGYNGRASSVVISGTDVFRPNGQLKPPTADIPHFGPCRRFDYELEMGAIVGTASEYGQPVTVTQADEMIFGFVLLNDWSARDIQAWEYVPLGPFQAKATATTISPWIVTKAALEPFRVSTPEREVPLLPHLHEPGPMLFDIDLEVSITPKDGRAETVLSRTNFNEMYYSSAQQLTHHTTSGCAMTPGDLLGSGTISGAQKDALGSMLELSWGGKEPITLTTGEQRSFIEDGDTIAIRGASKSKDYVIGFGECVGTVQPAVKYP
jgi:fumarylacetoacetase